jgi:hypothetical protein
LRFAELEGCGHGAQVLMGKRVSTLSKRNQKWLILDIGFSNTKKSCAILLGDGEQAHDFKFADAVNEVVNEVVENAKGTSLLNLVIEAPLSVAFDKSGNPKPRKVDKEGKQSRPWYFGPGCAVMVATMYLMKKLYDSRPSAEVRLFEGFVSFKSKETKSSHSNDAKCLRDAIKGEGTLNCRFYAPEDLKEDESDNVMSAFKLMNMDLGIPPVIKAVRQKSQLWNP